MLILQQVVVSAADGFAKIDAILRSTFEKLVLFDEYEKIYRGSKLRSLDLIHDALTKVYTDIIDLTLVTTKHYHRSTISM